MSSLSWSQRQAQRLARGRRNGGKRASPSRSRAPASPPRKPTPQKTVPDRPTKPHLGCVSNFDRVSLKTTQTKSSINSEHYKIFQFFDRDGSGFVDFNELMMSLKAIGITLSVKETLQLFHDADTDGNGIVSFEEFETMLGKIENMARLKHVEALNNHGGRAELNATHPKERTNSSVYRAFQFFDRDSSGEIDIGELKTSMKALGFELSDEKIANLMETFDKDHSGTLTFDEFEKMVDVLKEMERQQHVAELNQAGRHQLKPVQKIKNTMSSSHYKAFQWFDKDGSGSIDVEELFASLKHLGFKITMKGAMGLMKELDVDHSGDISFEEFEKLLERLEGYYRDQHMRQLGNMDKSKLKKVKTKSRTDSDHFKVFQWFDADNSGSIDASELEGGLRALGFDLSHDDCLGLLAETDTDHNGTLDFDEFEKIVEKVNLVGALAHLMEIQNHGGRVAMKTVHPKSQSTSKEYRVFHFFDEEATGAIDLDHLIKAFRALGHDLEITEAIDVMRAAGAVHESGEVSFEDFQAMLEILKDKHKESHHAAIAGHSKAKLKKTETKHRQSDNIHAIFAFFDTDGDGMISGQEMLSALRRIPGCEDMSAETVRAIYENFGRSFEDSLSYDEFCWFATHVTLPVAERTEPPPLNPEQQQALDFFKYIDADGSGSIDATELMAAYKELGIPAKRHEIFELIIHCDKDNSGDINFEEFCFMLKEIQKSPQERASREASVWSGPPPPPPPASSSAAAPKSRSFPDLRDLPPPVDIESALQATTDILARIDEFRSFIKAL